MPVFVLKGLHPDFGYDIVLTAKNAKGRSAETVHHMNTLNGAEKHTGMWNARGAISCIFIVCINVRVHLQRKKYMEDKVELCKFAWLLGGCVFSGMAK